MYLRKIQDWSNNVLTNNVVSSFEKDPPFISGISEIVLNVKRT